MSIAREFLVLLEAIAHVHKHPDPKGYVADVEAAWDALTEPEQAPARASTPDPEPFFESNAPVEPNSGL